ncbi:hypothetical protein CHH78_16870 [Shouchella clausii]|uniref:DUF1850 domain-containing protein n=1 Tax=Shouchella clausii TaxID=79880 RepID=UPI000BA5DFC3|nr:DUF1850 domain-containing protein [Shouchella clausii]MBU8598158.1 DUF1850 domain-containing protein [Shouchella clausii]MCY1105924.1 DUF1850 domain-containing protein [Shouchella clausii]MED4160922.1 DUF1850 domain-containing protein [Shouchella clausii]MED4178413.1 DUF1850 domain-containing protein [Shouchella clausii]PAD07842.1 hypothetical protein CHH76_17755 [Shouchella clausii]
MARLLLTRKYWVGIVLLLLLATSVLLIPFRTALVFYEENTTSISAYLPLKPGDTFEIIYTHSIHRSDVSEKYVILDNLTIQQYEFVFEEFGIGMPSNANGKEQFVMEDGKYYIRNMENIFPSFALRTGTVVPEHRLVWGQHAEHIAWFADYFDPGAWFTVKMERLNLWQQLKGEEINDK